MGQRRQHAAGVAHRVGRTAAFGSNAFVAQAQVQLPLRRDFPFVLYIEGLTAHLGFERLPFERRQQGIAGGVGGAAGFLAVTLLQVPAGGQGVGGAQQVAVLAGLGDPIVTAAAHRSQLLEA